jgi:hypothetical protein
MKRFIPKGTDSAGDVTKQLAYRVTTDRRFCGDEVHKALAEGVLALIAEVDRLKAENEALRKDSEAYRLLSFCHGQGTLELVRSHHELCAEIRRLKILTGEPVPPTPEEFVGPSPEGPTARIRRKLAAMGQGEQS